MLSIEHVTLKILPGQEGGKIGISVRGRDIVATGVRCALLDHKQHESLSPKGWSKGVQWQTPLNVSGGGDSIQIELDSALAKHLKRNKSYTAKFSFEVLGETFVRDASAVWLGDPEPRRQGGSETQSRFKIAVAAVGLLAVLAVGGGIYLGSPYDLGFGAAWANLKSAILPDGEAARKPSLRGSDELRAAAEGGDPDAAFLLASYYDPSQSVFNEGLSKNPATSYRWYQRAKELHHELADARLRELRIWVQQRVDEGDANLAPLLRLLLQR